MQKVSFYLALGLLVAKILNPGYGNFGQWGVAKSAFWAMVPKVSLPNLPVAAEKPTPSAIQMSNKCPNDRANKIYKNLGEICQ